MWGAYLPGMSSWIAARDRQARSEAMSVVSSRKKVRMPYFHARSYVSLCYVQDTIGLDTFDMLVESIDVVQLGNQT